MILNPESIRLAPSGMPRLPADLRERFASIADPELATMTMYAESNTQCSNQSACGSTDNASLCSNHSNCKGSVNVSGCSNWEVCAFQSTR